MAQQRGGGRRTDYSWIGAQFAQTVLTGTQGLIQSFEPGGTFTLMRSCGSLLIKGTPDAVADDVVVGLGITIVSTDASASGGTALPNPITDANQSWLWHQFVGLSAGSAGLLGDDIGSVHRVEIDSKAMRRMKTNQSIVLVGILSNSQYAAVITTGGIRFLLGS